MCVCVGGGGGGGGFVKLPMIGETRKSERLAQNSSSPVANPAARDGLGRSPPDGVLNPKAPASHQVTCILLIVLYTHLLVLHRVNMLARDPYSIHEASDQILKVGGCLPVHNFDLPPVQQLSNMQSPNFCVCHC